MDRSFLSQAEVIAASRQFVCVRLLTYESKTEAEFLKSLFVGKSGNLENTTFAILAADGKQPLVRPSRSPGHGLAAPLGPTMTRIAQQHPGRNAVGQPELPKAASVRLGLDVAACDNRPLAILLAKDDAALRKLATLAWSDDFVGRLIYATASAPAQLQAIEGVAPGSALIVVQPDRFGLKGRVLAQTAADGDLAKTLQQGITQHRPVDKSFQAHVREGHQQGIFWETPLPVTDPFERRAREQGRPKRP